MTGFKYSSLIRNRRFAVAGVGLALSVGAIIVVIAVSQVVDEGDSTASDDVGNANLGGRFAAAPNAPACRDGEPGVPLALLGRLRPGHTLAELPGSVRALDGGEEDLVVFWPGYNPISRSDLPDLPTHPALQSVGWLRPNTVDLSLRSCSYRLEDNASAAEIGKRATAYIVQQGLLSQAQIDGSGTTFQLAEDPTNAEHLFFSIVLADAASMDPSGAPPSTSGLTPYTAVIDKSSGVVLSAGRAHWYNLSCSLASPGAPGSIACSPNGS